MLAGGAGYCGGEVPERVEQVPAGLFVEPHRAGQAVRHGFGPGAHRFPGRGERDLDGALVVAPPAAGDQAESGMKHESEEVYRVDVVAIGAAQARKSAGARGLDGERSAA